jgi:membrane associated rhomboid family serine protease
VVAWLLVSALGLDAQAAVGGGFIPARLTYRLEGEGFLPALLTPFSAALLHANLLHLSLNLMMLLICGAPVERAIGRGNFVALYVIGALAAAGAQWAVEPASQVPMIGASGAISAIVGGYSLLFGRNRVRVANPALARALHVLWLAAAWIGLQLLFGLASRGSGGPAIATLAHVGGFLAGLALITPLHRLHWRRA